MKAMGKIVLLLISLMPFVAYGLLMTVFDGEVSSGHPLYIFGVLSFSLIPVQWIFYITNVFRNTGITTRSQRILWVWLLLGGNFAFPFYWYLHIWRDEDKPKEKQMPSEPVTPSLELPRFKNRLTKALILIASVLPIIFFLTAIISIYNVLSYSIFYAFGVLYWVSSVGLIVFYIVDVFHNQSVPRNQRVPWIFLLIFGNLAAFPFYWYIHIWKESSTSRPIESTIQVD